MATTTQGGFTAKTKSKPSERDRLGSPLVMALLYAVLIGGAIVTSFPFYLTLVTSTHRTAEILSIPPPLWFGNSLVQNYNELLASLPFWNALFNSFAISALTTLLVLFFCSLAGYGFAKFRFPGREGLFAWCDWLDPVIHYHALSGLDR
jgi:multiple sugar transport system permease protein